MDEQVNPLERDHCLSVVLPGGLEKNATVHGSKPVMDLLVTLCASYHLNPSDYTVEFLSPNKNNISFKPNSPIGSLEAEKIVLKPKGAEEKIRRPYKPEASVRLLINYNKSHKAVVRVSPRVPLEMLLPVVCDKCELNLETTILLRHSESKELLDLTKTLNEHGLREVFAKDTAAGEPVDDEQQPKTPEAVTPTKVISPPLQDLPKKKKNSGFLSLFRRGKKKSEMQVAVSAPVSPGPSQQVRAGRNGQVVSSSDTLQAEMPKKRPAPQPPMGASHSVPNNLSTCHLKGQSSAESTLRRTKRRAPPPPSADTHQELQPSADVRDSLNTVEELRESDESNSVNLSSSSSSSPHPQPWSSSSLSRPSFTHLHEIAEPYLPSLRGKDLSDARSALAKVLTSSVSKGALVKRLRNSATFPKLYNGSSLMSVTPRGSDNRGFWTERDPLPTSNLPTEPEWEDPVQKRGMTTFKVIPSKMQKPHEPELNLDVLDQIQVEDEPESEGSPKLRNIEIQREEMEEDPCSPDRSETQTPLQSPEPPAQEAGPLPYEAEPLPQEAEPSSQEAEPLPQEAEPLPQEAEPLPQEAEPLPQEAEPLPQEAESSSQEAEPSSQEGEPSSQEDEPSSQEAEPLPQEVEDSDRPPSPPPPIDLESQVSPDSPPPDAGDSEQSGEDEPEGTYEVIPAAPSDCSDGELPIDGQTNSEDQSEILQSPSRQSLSTVKEHCGSETNEMVVEEEVLKEEEDKEEEDDSFPPPPSPVFFNEDEEAEEEGRGDTASSLQSSQPQSPASTGKTSAMSEDHPSDPTSAGPHQPAAAPQPLDKTNAAPSGFAQAVALAVQRSRLQRHGKSLGPQAPSGPHSALPSPPISIYQFGA